MQCNNRIFSWLPTLFLVSLSLAAAAWKASEKAPEKPDENRFTKVVLATDLDEPMQFEIMKDGRVVIAERTGKIKVFDPKTSRVSVIADFAVSEGYYVSGKMVSPRGEDGMQGVVLDPDFERNHFLYLYYTPLEGSTSLLARFVWKGDSIQKSSRKILLEVPNQRETCCHLGGGMVFDPAGNLYLSTGDNTTNGAGGFPHLDDRAGRQNHDSQRSSSNTNDLRGKILRIHPEPDGTYTIPVGNLFPVGTQKTRPEIYTMGNRNPYRLSVDSKTGFLYWGEVGPGGTIDSVGRGPKSYDEFNRARKAGNFGWPQSIANNQAYYDYDYLANKSKGKFDVAHPVNHSANNTGLSELPPSEPALIWYPQTFSTEFPLLGTGSASAMGGPVYRRTDFPQAKRPFPAYYEGKWFITDWTRGWIIAVSLDENGDYKGMEQFMPGLQIQGPNDMEFGPDGDLYVLQYGRGPYKKNSEAQLFKIEYNDGNRKPKARLSVSSSAGAAPLKVALSAKGSEDYDKDALRYQWNISLGGKPFRKYEGEAPSLVLGKAGTYKVKLTVTDSKGAIDSVSTRVVVGNEMPNISLDLQGANRSFYIPDGKIKYSVQVKDKEDGSLSDGKIPASKVAFTIDYLSEGLDPVLESFKETDGIEGIPEPFAVQLMNKSDCNGCHIMDKPSIGPSFMQVSEKYQKDPAARAKLVKKVIAGGSGVWGQMPMPPHPTISEEDASKIVGYILGLESPETVKSLPLQGEYRTERKNANGSYVLRAIYTDKGTSVAPPQTAVAIVELKNPLVPAFKFDLLHKVDVNPQIDKSSTSIIPKGDGSYFVVKGVDLTNLTGIAIGATPMAAAMTSVGLIEVRLDSPYGKIIGTSTEISDLSKNGKTYKDIGYRADVQILPQKYKHDIFFVVRKSPEGNGRMRIRDVLFR